MFQGILHDELHQHSHDRSLTYISIHLTTGWIGSWKTIHGKSFKRCKRSVLIHSMHTLSDVYSTTKHSIIFIKVCEDHPNISCQPPVTPLQIIAQICRRFDIDYSIIIKLEGLAVLCVILSCAIGHATMFMSTNVFECHGPECVSSDTTPVIHNKTKEVWSFSHERI